MNFHRPKKIISFVRAAFVRMNFRWRDARRHAYSPAMLNDREHILSALREKPLKAFEIKKRANVVNDEACQALLLKMRDEGLVKFDIHKGQWSIV